MDDLPVNGHVWVPQSLVSLCFFMFTVGNCLICWLYKPTLKTIISELERVTSANKFSENVRQERPCCRPLSTSGPSAPHALQRSLWRPPEGSRPKGTG